MEKSATPSNDGTSASASKSLSSRILIIINLNILEKWVVGSWEEAKIDCHFTVREDSEFIVFSLRDVEIWHVHVTHSLHKMAAHFSIYIY